MHPNALLGPFIHVQHWWCAMHCVQVCFCQHVSSAAVSRLPCQPQQQLQLRSSRRSL
jgi:hypothetical protein